MAPNRVAALFLALALLFLSPGSGSAGFEEGYAAYERGNYHTAFREFIPLAVAGDDLAQAMIALMHHHGRGTPQDYVEAARWWRRSAEQGNPLSQHMLGLMFHDGLGVPQDFTQAMRWFRQAATLGFAAAQYSLGGMYATGRGVPQDDSEGVRWFRLAADQGLAEAQFDLGAAYANGWGVPQDGVLAYMWFNLAAARSPPGGVTQERAVTERDHVASRLSPGQRARAQEMARDWRATVAARSEGEATAYAAPERGEPPRTQRQVEPNPFRAALESQERRNREVQQLLEDLGYDAGPVDGVIGPQTRAAIRAFQADVGLPVDGEISDELYAALTDAVSSGQNVAAQSAPTEPRLDSTGTGFAVSQNGHVLTNHHVVADCAEVRVQPQAREAAAAVIVAHDPTNDLALLESPVSLSASAYLDDRGIRPGDSVVAVGFPLYGLLASEASVTTGTVSALAGIGNDARLFQVTVPVQPGNSGGPLLDLQGRVVGVVVGKLDAVQIASVTGDIPQNVNFAIKAGVVRTFLEASGLPTLDEAYGEEPQELRAAAVGAKAKEFTVLVECWK